jgi:hypothetical protein
MFNKITENNILAIVLLFLFYCDTNQLLDKISSLSSLKLLWQSRNSLCWLTRGSLTCTTKGHQQALSLPALPLYSFLFPQIVLKNLSMSDCNYQPVAVYMSLLITSLGVPHAWRLFPVCTR